MGKNTIIKDAIALLVITLVSGLCLGFVFSITEQTIADKEEQAKQDSYRAVFPGAEFEAVEGIDDSVLDNYNATADGAEITEVLAAVVDGNMEGYVISMTGTEGYGGDISMSMGIKSDGTITGFDVLSMSETAGLGAKCTTAEFKDQFKGKNEEEMVLNENFDQITSATITSRAIEKALNASLGFVRTLQ